MILLSDIWKSDWYMLEKVCLDIFIRYWTSKIFLHFLNELSKTFLWYPFRVCICSLYFSRSIWGPKLHWPMETIPQLPEWVRWMDSSSASWTDFGIAIYSSVHPQPYRTSTSRRLECMCGLTSLRSWSSFCKMQSPNSFMTASFVVNTLRKPFVKS